LKEAVVGGSFLNPGQTLFTLLSRLSRANVKSNSFFEDVTKYQAQLMFLSPGGI
jgi:hypothetical protein